MARKLSPQVADFVGYLADLGFEDLYVSDPPPAPPREADPIDLEKLAAVAEEAASCQACKLHEGRNQVVFGSGSPTADLMFIGEGPGAEEDRQGLPFVGPAGALLTKIIEAIDLTRDDVYIANVVKCRPPRNQSGTGRGFCVSRVPRSADRSDPTESHRGPRARRGTDTAWDR